MTHSERPLGMLVTCRRCGGTNEWTGRERRGEALTGLGDDPQAPNEYEMRAEIRCTGCGHTEWAAVGGTTP